MVVFINKFSLKWDCISRQFWWALFCPYYMDHGQLPWFNMVNCNIFQVYKDINTFYIIKIAYKQISSDDLATADSCWLRFESKPLIFTEVNSYDAENICYQML